MRKLFLLIFGLYWTSLLLPLTALAAGSQVDSLCPFGEIFVYNTVDSKADQDKAYEEIYAENESNLAGRYSASSCGEINDYTGLYEKGDCSADGKIVTEVTEVIAPEVELDEDNKVITVYAGLCCMAYTEDSTGKFTSCEDVRTIYTDSYENCNGFAQNCEKRQWVIGSSGIGVVKLFIKQIYAFSAITVGSVCVVTIVLHGIKISVSGISGDISDSKTKILTAIGGLVLLFLSGLLLIAINPGFFG